MRPELQPALDAARTLAPEELPHLIGELEELKATCLARLAAPPMEARPDRSLNLKEAADRLGVSRQYLYRHWRKFKFARQEGRKVLFSANALDAYLRRAR
jgi:excisionase family DNA binding protein